MTLKDCGLCGENGLEGAEAAAAVKLRGTRDQRRTEGSGAARRGSHGSQEPLKMGQPLPKWYFLSEGDISGVVAKVSN